MAVTHWIWLRGLAREARHHGELVHYFKKLKPQVEVFCLDLPGFGRRFQESSPTSIHEIRVKVANEMANIETKYESESAIPKWGIMAMSLGGMVTLDWISVLGNPFVQAVVVNSSALGLGLPVFGGRLRYTSLPPLIKTSISLKQLDKERAIWPMISNRPLHEDTIKKWAQYFREYPYTTPNVVKQLSAGIKFKAPSALYTPTLFISSTEDQMVSSQCTHELAKKYGMPELIHPWAGHDVALDDPEWLAHELAKLSAQ